MLKAIGKSQVNVPLSPPSKALPLRLVKELELSQADVIGLALRCLAKQEGMTQP